MVNLTPEPANSLPGLPVVPVKPRCGWCDILHVAEMKCNCTEPCGKGYCAAIDDGEMIWL